MQAEQSEYSSALNVFRILIVYRDEKNITLFLKLNDIHLAHVMSIFHPSTS